MQLFSLLLERAVQQLEVSQRMRCIQRSPILIFNLPIRPYNLNGQTYIESYCTEYQAGRSY